MCLHSISKAWRAFMNDNKSDISEETLVAMLAWLSVTYDFFNMVRDLTLGLFFCPFSSKFHQLIFFSSWNKSGTKPEQNRHKTGTIFITQYSPKTPLLSQSQAFSGRLVIFFRCVTGWKRIQMEKSPKKAEKKRVQSLQNTAEWPCSTLMVNGNGLLDVLWKTLDALRYDKA